MGCPPQDQTEGTSKSNIEPIEITVPSGPWDEWADKNPDWVEPIAPYQISGPVYYVGSKGLGAYLITGEDGHILLDGGLPQNGPMIEDSLSQLGFSLNDVSVLLNSHAHFDHSGGLAYLKAKSGAKLYASVKDAPWLETGFYPGADGKMAYSAPPVDVDQVIDESFALEFGNVKMSPSLTPGHSPGCTSWNIYLDEGGKRSHILIFGSATVAGNSLVPEQYPGIIKDFETTFEKMRDWSPDIALSNHPGHFFDQEEKMRRKLAGDAQAFEDLEIFQTQIQRLERAFQNRLNEERNKTKQ